MKLMMDTPTILKENKSNQLMKTFTFLFLFTFFSFITNAQPCEDLINKVLSGDNGTIYTSHNSESIAKVTFYEILIDEYRIEYYALVCFKIKDANHCSEYIYQVSKNTKIQYAEEFLESAEGAFWKYIYLYSKFLNCSPDFKNANLVIEKVPSHLDY